ncbi:hypothetical protein HN662_00060, partial [Candidatus Woesearchaeota archaeon]|nr:hypothetical protein [Candidatus Woesearchaeota archaeon]
MKKILLILCITLLLASVAMARQGEGVHEPGTGIENPELKAAGSGQGMDDNLDNEDDDLMDDDEDKTDSTENKQVQKQVRSEVQSQNRVRDA